MRLELFPLLAVLSAAACLLGWAGVQVVQLGSFARSVWERRKMAGKVRSLGAAGIQRNWRRSGICLLGILAGLLLGNWLAQVVSSEWLMISLVLLTILCQEAYGTAAEKRLLETIHLFQSLLMGIQSGMEIYTALDGALPRLVPGKVRQSAADVLQRRRCGEDHPTCFAPFCGLHPLLDEWLLSLRLSGWRDGPELEFLLGRLLARASRVWDWASWGLWVKDRLKVWAWFCQSASLAAILLALLRLPILASLAMMDRLALLVIGLSLPVLGCLAGLCLSHPWSRRLLVICLLAFSWITYTSWGSIQLPAWIQMQTLSHSWHIPLALGGG